MRIGIMFVFIDYHRKGALHRGVLQPQIGPLIASLLPPDVEVEVINDTWVEPDWNKDYDLLFLASLHSDFDRVRQISHYWRRRGAKTVYGGALASTYPDLCRPYFDSVVVGDPEGSVPQLYRDFCKGELRPVYVSSAYVGEDVPVPRFDLLADQQRVPLSLEATRGCPFTCEFCVLTGIGTRHHTRPPELVVRDIREGQRMLAGRTSKFLRSIVVFNDNNIGGNPKYLRQLCEALAPLGIQWGSAVTFNVVADLEMVKLLSRSGCRFMFVGLESFNQAALADMHKVQNAIDKTRVMMDQCRDHGILIVSGLMIDPGVDDCDYMRSIPGRLAESGLHVPGFICFECPIPGTPHFHRLAEENSPALLPNAYLRDFNAYTLVTRPRHESVTDYVATYEWLLSRVFSLRTKARKFADDLPRFLKGGYWFPALVDVLGNVLPYRPHPERTYLAGTDVPPPEVTNVPLTDDDFRSEEERQAIMEPWRVTDSSGHVLPEWRSSVRVFGPKGRISSGASGLRVAV